MRSCRCRKESGILTLSGPHVVGFALYTYNFRKFPNSAKDGCHPEIFGSRGQPLPRRSDPIEARLVYEPTDSPQDAPAAQGVCQAPKVLCLGGTHDAQVALRQRFGDEVEVVSSSPIRALSQLGSGEFIGIYADADHLAEVINVARHVQNERILQGMPD